MSVHGAVAMRLMSLTSLVNDEHIGIQGILSNLSHVYGIRARTSVLYIYAWTSIQDEAAK